MVEKEVISVIQTRQHFHDLLLVNPGIIVIKLGAKWCGPCKKIAHVVEAFFGTSPDDVVCADIDVDESVDFYTYLKSKKMVNGIPVLLCYKKGNNGFIPTDSVIGINPQELHAFFQRCGKHLENARRNV